jgi:beta-xylosidase
MKRIVILLMFLISLAVKAQEKNPVYLFSYFKNNGQDGLHLAFSRDGLTWQALKNDESFLKPEVSRDKLMRDPCIIRGADGKFHMVWTVSWTDKTIGYASSTDLIHWSPQIAIPVMAHEEGARNCWAPEITYDAKKKQYMIYWATTIKGKFLETASEKENGYNHRMYYTLTKDFKSFSPTRLLYEPGFNVIDASILKDGKRYVMFLKDETREPVQKNLKIAYSKKINGPYSTASKPFTGKYWAEGPTAFKHNGYWIVYFDKYTLKQYGALKSKDLENWEDLSDKISLPKGIRHGSILNITEEELQKLMNVKTVE